MTHVALAMSETKQSDAQMKTETLDAAVRAVKAQQQAFARLPVAEKLALVEACVPLLEKHGPEWVRLGVEAKGIDPQSPLAGEEWFLGPVVTMRHLKLLARALDAIRRTGSPPLGKGVRTLPDGRLAVNVMPTDLMDAALFTGIKAECRLQPGIDERAAREKQASFYKQKDPEGGLSVVLGAGNVAFLTPGDFLTEMFNDGFVSVVKMNPVNEYLGPVFEKVFAPLIEKNYLRIVYGGGEVGAFLTSHEAVDKIHMTGSDRVHDLIVWGPPGPERDARKAAKNPVNAKEFTSELGCVTPVIVPPAKYSASQLTWHARNVATQVASNASYMCVAAKMLVLSKGWAQKDEFIAAIKRELASQPLRKAYYPGAHDRYSKLTAGRTVEAIGTPAADELPWAIITGLDAAANDNLFQTEPFCSLISIVELDPADATEFLEAAVTFANDKLWGTLTANLIVHPSLEKSTRFAAALEKAIDTLRYGTVSLNQWSGVSCGLGSTPWGGHPSATLEDIQSGRGWVHNTFMIEGIEKVVMRSPFIVRPTPVWFTDHQTGPEVGRKLTSVVASDSWMKVPSLFASALRG